MKQHHQLEHWLHWMDQLSQKDFVVIDGFLSLQTFQEVKSLFLKKLPSFTKTGIGSNHSRVIRHDIRGDFSYWLDPKTDTQLSLFWALIDELISMLNRYCYLSLSGHEFHFTNYPPGAYYLKHLDQFENRSNRIISVVIYLNEDWCKSDGGELEIFGSNNTSYLISPLACRCVMFKSDKVPHQVLRSKKDRYSVSGWLTHLPGSMAQFFG